MTSTRSHKTISERAMVILRAADKQGQDAPKLYLTPAEYHEFLSEQDMLWVEGSWAGSCVGKLYGMEVYVTDE